MQRRIIVFFLFSLFQLQGFSQKEKGFMAYYYAGAGLSFHGTDNYFDLRLGYDELLPSFYDYKFYGGAIDLSYYSNSNFFTGLSYYLKPFRSRFLRNPYFFPVLNINGGFVKNMDKDGVYLRPELAFLFNGKAYDGVNIRFRLGVSYDISSIGDFNVKQPGFNLRVILGYNQKTNCAIRRP